MSETRKQTSDELYDSLCRQAAEVAEVAELFEGERALTLCIASENLYQRAYDLEAQRPALAVAVPLSDGFLYRSVPSARRRDWEDAMLCGFGVAAGAFAAGDNPGLAVILGAAVIPGYLLVTRVHRALERKRKAWIRRLAEPTR